MFRLRGGDFYQHHRAEQAAENQQMEHAEPPCFSLGLKHYQEKERSQTDNGTGEGNEQGKSSHAQIRCGHQADLCQCDALKHQPREPKMECSEDDAAECQKDGVLQILDDELSEVKEEEVDEAAE